MDLDPLSRIAIRQGGDKFGSHVYTPIYHQLFGAMRYLPLRLLELGIGGYGDERAGGSSLLAWAEYFPYASVVGLDIANKRLELPGNVTVYQGSQNDPVVLGTVVDRHGPFDIIIDDASHQVGLTEQTFMHLYPGMAPRGIYVVEDTQTSFYPNLGGRPAGRQTMFHVAHAVSLAMHRSEGARADPAASPFDPATASMFPDHQASLARFGEITEAVRIHRNLIIFHRGDNSYPANTSFDFTHPQVIEHYRTMEQLALSSPSPRDSLARIDMDLWAGRNDQAAALAMKAARSYPNEAMLLHELRFLMRRANRGSEIAVLDGMIAAL